MNSWQCLHGIWNTLATGKRATCRHDGTPWEVSDRARAKLAAKKPDLPFRAALCEVRGDWKFYKECFNFPAWKTLEGITPTHISLRIYTPRPQEEPPPQEEGHNHGSGGGGGREEGRWIIQVYVGVAIALLLGFAAFVWMLPGGKIGGRRGNLLDH